VNFSVFLREKPLLFGGLSDMIHIDMRIRLWVQGSMIRNLKGFSEKEDVDMAMDLNGVNGISTVTPVTPVSTTQQVQKVAEDVKETKKAEEGVVYEKGQQEEKTTYTPESIAKQDRSAIVEQMKADLADRQQKLLDLVRQTLSGQVESFATATDDEIWKKLASGDFTVDAATKKQAQEDISEDGYWGVKKTSQRLFDFAKALSGGDEAQMKKMQEAMEKGFKEATKTWGRDLPEISQNTLDAANKLFDDYYASLHQTEEVEA